MLNVETGDGSGGSGTTLRDSGIPSLRSWHHISLLCEDVDKSANFYKDILGFDRITNRPPFKFKGHWLCKYGINIHLLECKDPKSLPKKRSINPIDNHIAFQCDDIEAAARKLKEKGLNYLPQFVQVENMRVDQLFFYDPEHNLIELCTCENFKPEIEAAGGDGNKAVNAETYGVKTNAES